MVKNILLLLVALMSCKNINNKKEKEFFTREEAIIFATKSLKQNNKSKNYFLYYVVPTNEALYVIYTDQKYDPDYIYFYKTTNTITDTGEYIFEVDTNSVDIKIPKHLDGVPISELQGMIFKKSMENNFLKYTLIKEGDILKDVENDPELIIEEVPEDD